MSWDVSIKVDCDVCHQHNDYEVRNVTYNNSKIFTCLGVNPSDLDGKSCIEISEKLSHALHRSFEIESDLKKLEPDNGWGGLEDSRDFITKLHRKCLEHPNGKVRVS